jgi:outer membrane receptor protein involved in Fe transport
MIAACAIIAAPAFAQDSGGPGTSSAASGSDGSRDDLLQEVRVTARRRSEIQAEVPVSITAYSADFLQKQNIQSFADYATRIPNLTFQYGGAGATGFSEGRVTSIRGIAGANTTAFYINDTPIPSAVTPQTLNLERIEVLKGPQGTLFGASSMGGNLRFITGEPSLTENSLGTEVGVGATKSGGADVDANGRGSFVLIPRRLAMDAAAGYTRESGYITRRFPDASGALVSRDDQGRNETLSASFSIRAALSDRLEASFSGLGQKSELNGLPVAYVPLPDYRVVSYTMDRDRDVQEYSKDRWGLTSLVLKYNATAFSVISSTSYFSRRVEELADSTEGTNEFIAEAYGVDIGDPAWAVISIDDDRQFTQETRLAFDKDAFLPKLSGVVGVFYQRNSSRGYTPAIFVPELAASGLYAPGYLASSNVPSLETQTALFGEIYYEVVPKLTVTLGLRQYRIRQHTDEEVLTGLIAGDEPIVSPPLRNKQSGAVPKAVISYEIGDRGTVYASLAKGFRVGGAQSELPDFCDQDLEDLGYSRSDIRGYKSDSLWSYEVGAKNNFADGRLAVAAAAFQIDWNKIQQSVVLPICTFSFTGNAGKARIRGAEFELSGRPLADVPLTLQLGVGYAHGILLDPGLIPQAANTELVQIPRWTPTLSGYYEAPISGSAALFVAADYSYTSTLKAVDGQGGFVTRQPLNMVDGNVGVRFGQTEIRLYGRNLLDRRLNYGDLYATGFERHEVSSDGTVQRYPQSAVSRPRQIGLQVSMEF